MSTAEPTRLNEDELRQRLDESFQRSIQSERRWGALGLAALLAADSVFVYQIYHHASQGEGEIAALYGGLLATVNIYQYFQNR